MKKRFRQKVCFILILVFILSLTIACRDEGLVKATGVNGGSSIILSTTTSTENSGLLDFLLPTFTEDTGIEVKVVAVGTGQALKMGEDGDADVLLVHAKSSEEEFIKAGHGLERFDVMYNDFILIGPVNDPLNVKEFASADIAKGLYSIHEHNATFISRGDDSGTHKMELSLWQEIGIEPQGDWYFSVGQGMGQVIQIANEKLAYTLSDRATYLSMLDKIELEIIIEGDNRLFNQYGIIAVNPEKSAKINHSGAQEFKNWILSEKGQQLIGEFGKDIYGQSLFIPNAEK